MECLRRAKVIFITLGTSWVYSFEGSVVSNCHKQPSSFFEKKLLSVAEIKQSILATKELIQEINEGIELVYTISPVRHIKDTLHLNNVSKSSLHLALYQSLDQIKYFPSYEIIIDELRDYRFFKEDLIHPSKQAVDYVFDILVKQATSLGTQEIIKKANKAYQGLMHKSSNPDSDANRSRLQNIRNGLKELSQQGAHVSFYEKMIDDINKRP